MSSGRYPEGMERSEHVGALSAAMFDPDANDGVRESLLSIFGFYSAYQASPNEEVIRQRKEWREKNDPMNTYYWNSRGYRDVEPSGTPDIIASGCSQTVGQGVPVESRWSNQLADKLGMTVATVAVPGWSIQRSINAVMHYILTYGKPKIVALLLPDMFRYDLILNPQVVQDRYITSGREDFAVRRTTERGGAARDMPKLSKRPHVADEVISSEIAYFTNGQILRMFIEYCKEAEIQLVWGTWERSVNEIVSYVSKVTIEGEMEDQAPKVDFSNYVEMDYFHQHQKDTSMSMKTLSCHSDLKEKYEPYFDLGTDTDEHMGVHLHAHIADKFYERLMKLRIS